MKKPNPTIKQRMQLIAAVSGVQISHWIDNSPMISREGTDKLTTWSPATNDGDAFRLMVQHAIVIPEYIQTTASRLPGIHQANTLIREYIFDQVYQIAVRANQLITKEQPADGRQTQKP